MKNTYEIGKQGHVIGKTSKGDTFIFDINDFAMVAIRTWDISNCGYVISGHITMHRFLFDIPAGELIDHANGDRTDNRRCNLRIASASENNANRSVIKKHGASTKYKGVVEYNAGRYRATIGYHYKRIQIGYFKTAESAARAYNKRAVELFGNFAKLNNV